MLPAAQALLRKLLPDRPCRCLRERVLEKSQQPAWQLPLLHLQDEGVPPSQSLATCPDFVGMLIGHHPVNPRDPAPQRLRPVPSLHLAAPPAAI
mmetsp:Transcript_42766/g.93189  ORF Transcript_42766/g.93189 Transcript_42766/m.93189 type:complete len:94 (+) Transcript_42766:15-296(+)